MNMYLVKMNDGSWGCLSDADNIFLVKARDKQKAEMIVRNKNNKYLKNGTYVKYAWDCLVSEVNFDEEGIIELR